jgi:hypothetical protein
MANQAIALQARAPRGNILGPAIQQGAQMVNMMRQQETADRQAAATNQQLEIARAKEAREIPLANAQLGEAEAKGQAARIKATSDFFDLTVLGLKNSKSLDDAVKVGGFLKENFKEPVFQQAVDQTMATLPKNPADFETWREQTMYQAMTGAQQLSQTVREQSSGTERRLVTTPMYTGGPRGNAATEIPGSRVRLPEEIAYIRDGQGRVIPMPKTVAGTGGFEGEINAPVEAPMAAPPVAAPQAAVAMRRPEPARPPRAAARDIRFGQAIPGTGRLPPVKSPPAAPRSAPATTASGKPLKTTEAERRFGTISRQMSTNLQEVVDILENNPQAIRPSGVEYAASQLPFVGAEAKLFAQNQPRQQFEASVLRFLDNVTFVNTGAGTSKAQEENYRRSYIPTYQDTPASAYRKLKGMVKFAQNVKDAAGVLWSPALDADFNMLSQAVEGLAQRSNTKAPSAPPPPPARNAPSGWGKAKVVGN